MHLDLEGRYILVTGASRGIGRALAEGLADAGATVGVHYARSREAAEELADELGHGARAFQADLAALDAPRRLWDDVLDAFGRLDVLVNNAGVAVELPLGEEHDGVWAEGWERTMNVNLRAPSLLCRLFARHVAARHAAGERDANGVSGRVVNVASRAAHRGDAPGYAAYAASKAGLVALTKTLARGHGSRGLAAFAVAPGFVRTDMAQPFFDAYGEEVATGNLALARLPEPRDLAPLVVLLASGLADHATGTTVDVNTASYVR